MMVSKRNNVIIAGRSKKGKPDLHSRPDGLPKPAVRLSARPAAHYVQNEMAGVQQLRLCLRRELELARQMRAEAEKYRLETETRARSDAQRLILGTRLSIKKEISRLESEAEEQMKKVLTEIRLIRLAAQEELEAQQRFTSAAKIRTLSLAFQDGTRPTPEE